MSDVACKGRGKGDKGSEEEVEALGKMHPQ